MTVLEQTEKEFQAAVVKTARLLGWGHIYHTHDSRRSAHGFPDLVLIHPKRGVLFVELKSERGKLSWSQREWLEALQAAGAQAYEWRPSDWDEIVETLSGHKVRTIGYAERRT